MKRHEKLMAAIEWYQAQTGLVSLTCRDDGIKLIGRSSHVGTVCLECPSCGLRLYQIPDHVLKRYMEVKDVSTWWQIREAHKLAAELDKTVPVEVLHSAMKLKNYINSIKGQIIQKEGTNGKAE